MNVSKLASTPLAPKFAQKAPQGDQPPSNPSDALVASLPQFAKSPLAQLRNGELPPGVSKGELTAADQQECGKAAFAASMLSSMDEKPGQDEAMGQPGRVVQNGLTCDFLSAGKNQIEAVLYGKNDASGQPAALYVKADNSGIQSFGFLDHGSSVEVKGQVMKPTAPKQFEGYVVAGSIASA